MTSSSVCLPLLYFPPIEWFGYFIGSDEVLLETQENFPKQTYRNRMDILGANGKLTLSIPIRKQHLLYRQKSISYAEDWQRQHWKSLVSAYKNSPYFDYYEAQLKVFYHQKVESLMDFNLNILEEILKIIGIDKDFHKTKTYNIEVAGIDLRAAFSPKAKKVDCPVYQQVFSEKLGFIPNLSILDLLCNLGPESLGYLKQLNKK